MRFRRATSFQHTAARRRLDFNPSLSSKSSSVSTHSRPKAAGSGFCAPLRHPHGFQHTAARRRLVRATSYPSAITKFQHTAARRRLGLWQVEHVRRSSFVSTHSRPKAAGSARRRYVCQCNGFNTQPPEGGWICVAPIPSADGLVSTHSRPKAAGRGDHHTSRSVVFQHTAARRRLG